MVFFDINIYLNYCNVIEYVFGIILILKFYEKKKKEIFSMY